MSADKSLFGWLLINTWTCILNDLHDDKLPKWPINWSLVYKHNANTYFLHTKINTDSMQAENMQNAFFASGNVTSLKLIMPILATYYIVITGW